MEHISEQVSRYTERNKLVFNDIYKKCNKCSWVVRVYLYIQMNFKQYKESF